MFKMLDEFYNIYMFTENYARCSENEWVLSVVSPVLKFSAFRNYLQGTALHNCVALYDVI